MRNTLQQYGLLKLLEDNAFVDAHYLECLTPDLTLERIEETLAILSNLEIRLPLLIPQIAFLAQQIHQKKGKKDILQNQRSKVNDSLIGCLWGFITALLAAGGLISLRMNWEAAMIIFCALALIFLIITLFSLSNNNKEEHLFTQQIAQIDYELGTLEKEVSAKLCSVLHTDNIVNIQNFSSNLMDFVDSLKKIEMIKQDNSLSETQKMLALESLFSAFHQKILGYHQRKELAYIASCAEQQLMIQQDMAEEQRSAFLNLQNELQRQTEILEKIKK